MSLQVKLPPAKDIYVVYDNEKKLGMLIYQISPTLSRLQVDIWTSRHEIGQVCETTGYVRWPYYLGEHVESLCAQLNKVKLGTRALQCQVVFAGRAPLHKDLADVVF